MRWLGGWLVVCAEHCGAELGYPVHLEVTDDEDEVSVGQDAPDGKVGANGRGSEKRHLRGRVLAHEILLVRRDEGFCSQKKHSTFATRCLVFYRKVFGELTNSPKPSVPSALADTIHHAIE